jgi:hypothetical protein
LAGQRCIRPHPAEVPASLRRQRPVVRSGKSTSKRCDRSTVRYPAPRGGDYAATR